MGQDASQFNHVAHVAGPDQRDGDQHPGPPHAEADRPGGPVRNAELCRRGGRYGLGPEGCLQPVRGLAGGAPEAGQGEVTDDQSHQKGRPDQSINRQDKNTDRRPIQFGRFRRGFRGRWRSCLGRGGNGICRRRARLFRHDHNKLEFGTAVLDGGRKYRRHFGRSRDRNCHRYPARQKARGQNDKGRDHGRHTHPGPAGRLPHKGEGEPADEEDEAADDGGADRPGIEERPVERHSPLPRRPVRAAAIRECIRSSSIRGTFSARIRLNMSSDAAPLNTRSRNRDALSSRLYRGL